MASRGPAPAARPASTSRYIDRVQGLVEWSLLMKCCHVARHPASLCSSISAVGKVSADCDPWVGCICLQQITSSYSVWLYMPQSANSQTCCPPLSDCSFSTDSCSAPLQPRQGVPSPVKRKPTSHKKPTSHTKPSPKPQHPPTAYPPCQSWAHGVASVVPQSALPCSPTTV